MSFAQHNLFALPLDNGRACSCFLFSALRYLKNVRLNIFIKAVFVLRLNLCILQQLNCISRNSAA